ncbi:MAG: nucleoside kinase [Kiritimatiellia bacterium]
MPENPHIQHIHITLPDGQVQLLHAGRSLRTLFRDQTVDGLPILGALVNNDLLPLYHPLQCDATVQPVTIAHPQGWRIYRWSLCFLVAKAMHELFPGENYCIGHAYGNAIHWSADWSDGREKTEALERKLRELVDSDLPIQYENVPYETAIERLTQAGFADKARLLAHRNPPYVPLIRCGDFLDLCQGIVTHRTGGLKLFKLLSTANGFILNLPESEHPENIAPLPPFDYLFGVFKEHASWGKIIGITNVSELNGAILSGRVRDFVLTAEALHEKKLASIADRIASHVPNPRLVLIAGPSSAGKTTTAKRLMAQLRILGFRPLQLSTDDYFVGDARNPRDSEGRLDYEHIRAMDLDALNRDVMDLLSGKRVRLARFDFKNRQPGRAEEETFLPENGILVMEGIHSLNPDLTRGIPDDLKFKLFVNAFTQLSIDRNNRIATTDNRLLRRMVRDWLFRGHGPLDTLRRWPSVLAGEQRWIYPYQHLADAVFNSALDYELAVLKRYAAPLLNQVKPADPLYCEARRLSGFLQNFVSLDAGCVPGNSLLREHIGGSQLIY